MRDDRGKNERERKEREPRALSKREENRNEVGERLDREKYPNI